MSNQNTYSDIVTELQRSYEFFYDYFKLRDDRYKDVIVTVQSSGRKNASGWVGESFWFSNDEKRTELNISAEFLSKPITDILGTLLHQMAHLKNSFELGIDPNQKYHTKNFKEAAELFGLHVSKVPCKGFALTGVNGKAVTAIKALDPRKEVYCFSRAVDVSTTPPPAKKYYGIFIDEKYSDNLDRACKSLNLRKKEVIEQYLMKF